MRPLLSPAEVLGLSGAALEGRVRSASHDLSEDTVARLADRLRADAWASRMIYEHEGVEEAVRIMTRPLLVIFLTIFVNLVGFGIIIPLLPFYAETFGASPLVLFQRNSFTPFLSAQCSVPVIGRLANFVLSSITLTFH